MEHKQTQKGKVKSFICDICGEHKQNTSDFTTGYGTNSEGQIVCYSCCAIQDEEQMKRTGEIVLYLGKDADTGAYVITNWPSTLKFSTCYASKGRHNIAGVQRHVWFHFNGYLWHGRQYGNNNDICRCKQTKIKEAS